MSNLMFFSCKSDVEIISEITADSKFPSFIVKELETYYSDSGIVQVKIYAQELIRYEYTEENYDEYPKGIEVEFFDNYMETTATLKSQYAIYYIDEKIWEAKYNVEVNNIAEDESLNTELLYWDLDNERIYSDNFVRIKTQKEILFGRGFESNQDFSKWRILNPTGTIIIDEDE